MKKLPTKTFSFIGTISCFISHPSIKGQNLFSKSHLCLISYSLTKSVPYQTKCATFILDSNVANTFGQGVGPANQRRSFIMGCFKNMKYNWNGISTYFLELQEMRSQQTIFLTKLFEVYFQRARQALESIGLDWFYMARGQWRDFPDQIKLHLCQSDSSTPKKRGMYELLSFLDLSSA